MKTIDTAGLTEAQIDSVEAYVFAVRSGDTKGMQMEVSTGWIPTRSSMLCVHDNYRIAKPTAEDYLKGHRECGLKVGDRVRVTRTYGSHEGGYAVVACKADVSFVGRVFTIIKDDGINGFEIADGLEENTFPYFCLEKVEPEYRPWTPVEAIGQKVKHKEDLARIYVINAVNLSFVYMEGKTTNYINLLSTYAQLDGSPCGVLIEGGAA